MKIWQSSGNGVYVKDEYPPNLPAKTFLFNSNNMPPNGKLEQTFKTLVGASYTLTFKYGYLRSGNSQKFEVQKLEVQVDGTAGAGSLLDEYVNIDSAQTYTAQFTADSDTTTLRFLDYPSNDTIDNDSWIKAVSVVGPPPQPKCSDFSTQKNAQATFDAQPGDPYHLDGNGDGIACLRENRDYIKVKVVFCSDFQSQQDAQFVLDTFPKDPFNLDPENNGIACQNL